MKKWVIIIGYLITILGWWGCARQAVEGRDSTQNPLTVAAAHDAEKLKDEEQRLLVTPEKAALHPDYQILENISVPFAPEYRIGPGDVVEVIYNFRYDQTPDAYRLEVQDKISVIFPFHPQFSSTVVVRTDGKISLPLVGDVQAATLTPADLAKNLNRVYSAYLIDPQITVSLEDFNVKIKELKRSITTAPRGQSKVAPVAPDGRIALPLLGNLVAEGFTLRQFEDMVNREYSKQVRNLNVTLVLLEIHHSKFYILGEVGRPGAYEMTSRLNLLDALAMAEGFKKSGDLKEVLVIRNDGLERPMAFKVNLSKMLKDPSYYADLKIRPADIIYVPKTGLDHINDVLEKIFTKGIYTFLPFQSVFSVNYDIRK